MLAVVTIHVERSFFNEGLMLSPFDLIFDTFLRPPHFRPTRQKRGDSGRAYDDFRQSVQVLSCLGDENVRRRSRHLGRSPVRPL